MTYDRARSSTRPPFERLEDRLLMAATPPGPKVIGEHFIGPMNAVTAVVLQFNAHLNPTTATDPAAYAIGRHFPSDNNDNSGGLGGGGIFSPFDLAPAKTSTAPTATSTPVTAALTLSVPPALQPKASVGSVTYDDATQTVTLTAQKPFQANVFFRYLRIHGHGPHAVRDVNGNALNKGQKQIIRWHFHRTKALGYNDANGDHVVLKLKGPGQITAFLTAAKDPAPLIFFDKTNPATSILTGTIKRARKSDGTTVIQELSNTSTLAQINLPPTFTITTTQA